MIMCYNLLTKLLVSVCNQNTDGFSNSGKKRLMHIKKNSDGTFLEKYTYDEDDMTAYYLEDENNNRLHKINIQEGSFEYGCNRKHTFDSGIEMFEQNPITNVESFPHASKINQIINENNFKPYSIIYFIENKTPFIYLVISDFSEFK